MFTDLGPAVTAPLRLALPPPPALAAVLRYFHLEHSSPGPVLVPATPYPMLTFFLAGGTQFAEPGGRIRVLAEPFVSGPLSAPVAARWAPGTSFIAAVLADGQFARLFDMPLSALRDSVVPLAELAPDWDDAPALAERLRGGADGRAAMSAWLLARLARRSGGEPGLILPPALLALPAAALAERYGLGLRQLERRFLASYGQSLRDTRRMQRYVRALGAMLLRPPAHGELTRLAVDSGYHDQAHMVRDFVQYTGLAPRALLAGAADAGGAQRLLRYEGASRQVVGMSPRYK